MSHLPSRLAPDYSSPRRFLLGTRLRATEFSPPDNIRRGLLVGFRLGSSLLTFLLPLALLGFSTSRHALTPVRPFSRPPDRSLPLPRGTFSSCPLQPHPSIHASRVGRPWTVAYSPPFTPSCALAWQVRLSAMPNRGHFRSGPTFRLGLLPTPPRDDPGASGGRTLFVGAKEMTFTF